MCVRYLQMLGIDMEFVLSPRIAWLQSYPGLSADGVASVIKASPSVLGLTVESLGGKVRFGW